MKLRKTLAGVALVGSLTVGGYAGVAYAQNATPTNPAGQTQTACDKAHNRLIRVHSRIDALKDRIATAETRVGELRASGDNTRADKIAKRIDAGNARLIKLEDRDATIEARVAQSCTQT